VVSSSRSAAAGLRADEPVHVRVSNHPDDFAAYLGVWLAGGVYVAGGIAPKMLDFMKDGRFREAFVSKGRMRPVLEQMPVQIVLDARAGVLGAAALAARESQLAPQTRNTPSTSPE